MSNRIFTLGGGKKVKELAPPHPTNIRVFKFLEPQIICVGDLENSVKFINFTGDLTLQEGKALLTSEGECIGYVNTVGTENGHTYIITKDEIPSNKSK